MLKAGRLALLMSLLVLLVGATAACGLLGEDEPSDEPTPVGDVANGEALFFQPTIGDNNAPGCVTCHSLEPDVVVVGPSQAGLAARAAVRVPGQSAEEYIRNSIVNPDEYVVEGFVAGLMYQHYADELTAEQIDDLVAFGLTLE